MPRDKKVVSTAGGSNNQAVDPVPPDNMWEELERELAAITKRPPNSFTRGEYQEKFGLTRSTAQVRINELVRQGKVERDERKFYVWKGRGK